MNRLALLRHAALITVFLVSGLSARKQAAQAEAGPLRYARIATDGARILNLADSKGVVVARPARDSLIAVYDENPTGWLLVEVPGGYALWVYGRYLAETAEPDVFEVTRNAVNIRPGPSSDVTHFPLPERLHTGDRVRVIEVLDEGEPLAETWVRIWSPPGVRAWIEASATKPLTAGEDGAALWEAALAAAPPSRSPAAPAASPTTGKRTEPVAEAGQASEANAPKEPTAEDLARADLKAAQELLERESAREAPDFPSVRNAIEAVLARPGVGSVAFEARETLRRLEALEEAAALKAELVRERERRAARAMEEQRRVWEASKKKDPLGDVFLARGVLYRNASVDGVPQYYLRFGGETVCELFCSSGRYDFELFAGYEVGVQGSELRTVENVSIPPVEVSRIEIIARR